MKTVINAVNDLKGDLESSKYTRSFYHASRQYLNYSYAGWDLNVDSKGFGTVIDFILLVNELSHAQWIKGASLAEYQAADKEVLQVEGEAVEVGGELYQLEKDYEFKNCGDKYWVNGCLDNVRGEGELRFASNGFWWKWCRQIDKSNLGTITPAPIKLIDGEVYHFELNCDLWVGFYRASRKSFFTQLVGGNKICSPAEVKQISILVPKV